MAKVQKTRFRNTSKGYVGVCVYKPNGDEHGISVEPEGTVELSQDEIELTARAPREAKDNPFVPQPYEIRDPATDEVLESGVRALLVPDESERYTPPVGSRPDGEEVGTPKATVARKRRPRAKATAKA